MQQQFVHKVEHYLKKFRQFKDLEVAIFFKVMGYGNISPISEYLFRQNQVQTTAVIFLACSFLIVLFTCNYQ
jgi:predicted adenine nucleotide alpha hydrolase (AANH) superfamily ATPase